MRHIRLSNLWLAVFGGLAITVLAKNAADATANRSLSETPTATWILKNIEEIRPGDRVASRNARTGEIIACQVEGSFSRTTDHLLSVVVEDGQTARRHIIQTTVEHPFWVIGKEWVPAGRLCPGDQLLQLDGQWSTVLKSEFQRHPNGFQVFNMTVPVLHNYFVAASVDHPPISVHNADCYDFAEGVLKEEGGVIIQMKPNDEWMVGQLPGYSPEDSTFWSHAFHLKNGIVKDPGNPGGMDLDAWLEAYANGNAATPSDIQDMVHFRPWNPGDPRK